MAIKLNDRRRARSAKRASRQNNASSRRTRGKRGFTIVEITVSMALIALLTAAFIATCTVSTNLQARASNAAQACTAASEFIAAYSRAEGDSEDAFFNSYHEQLSLSLGITIDFTVSGGEITVGGADGDSGAGFAADGITFQTEKNADGSIAYHYSTPQVRVEATAEYGGGITAKGYVSGYTTAVCEYSAGGEVSA